jgi:peptidoglycan hydrolase-like protein with peptidoglycan-binding domain
MTSMHNTQGNVQGNTKRSTGAIAGLVALAGVAVAGIVVVAALTLGGHGIGTHAATDTPTPAAAAAVTPAPAPASSATAKLQRELAQLNYYNGAIDGRFGPETSQAISYLQRDAGLPQTGQMNSATQAALAHFLAHGNNQMNG